VESSKSGRDVGSSVGPQPWTSEARALASNTAPLVITFLFQHMLDVVSMIAAGKLGTVELGAVSCKSSTISNPF
jgi:MATE family multidrug resistance protein